MSNKFKVTVLGSGGAFATMKQGNSAFLVDYKDRRILIDCGGTVPYVLRDEMGIPLQSITDIIVTHAHGDHISGLEHLIYSCYFLGDKRRLYFWMSDQVAYEVIEALGPGLRNLRGKGKPMGPGTWFPEYCHEGYRVQKCNEGQWDLCGLILEHKRVTHVEQMPATSVRLGPLFISGDTNAPVCPPHDVELVFHEAEFGFSSGVHCPVEHLVNTHHPLRDRTWLYHCPPDVVEAPEGFAGILRKGQTFEIEIP